jgi:hypothetical protein
MLHLDIFIVLVLLGVYNLITEMRDYQHVNKTRVKQSYKYRHLLWQTSHDEIAITDRKTTDGLPSGK